MARWVLPVPLFPIKIRFSRLVQVASLGQVQDQGFVEGG